MRSWSSSLWLTSLGFFLFCRYKFLLYVLLSPLPQTAAASSSPFVACADRQTQTTFFLLIASLSTFSRNTNDDIVDGFFTETITTNFLRLSFLSSSYDDTLLRPVEPCRRSSAVSHLITSSPPLEFWDSERHRVVSQSTTINSKNEEGHYINNNSHFTPPARAVETATTAKATTGTMNARSTTSNNHNNNNTPPSHRSS